MARIAMVGDLLDEVCVDGALREDESSDNVTAGGRFVALVGFTSLTHSCGHSGSSSHQCWPSSGSPDPNIYVNGEILHKEGDQRECITHFTHTNTVLLNNTVNVFCNE